MAGMPLVRTITQVGIVVRDLDRALADYSGKFGVGPPRVSTYAPPRLTGTRIRGIEAPYGTKEPDHWYPAPPAR